MQEVSIRGIDCLLVRSSTVPLLAHSCPRFKIWKLDDNVRKLRNCRCRAIYVKYTDVAKSPSNPRVGLHCCQENTCSLCTFLDSSLGHLMPAPVIERVNASVCRKYDEET